jgi:hypothetical protein
MAEVRVALAAALAAVVVVVVEQRKEQAARLQRQQGAEDDQDAHGAERRATGFSLHARRSADPRRPFAP